VSDADGVKLDRLAASDRGAKTATYHDIARKIVQDFLDRGKL
jgi:hypothetical protein